MALRITENQVDLQRTIRPNYAHTQATPWGGFLDPEWDKKVDVYPGMAVTRVKGELFRPITSADEKFFGLAALFVAPQLGIDETRSHLTGRETDRPDHFTAWVGDEQATFEILAPAFAESAVWSNEADADIDLFITTEGHEDGPGKLTTGSGANIGTEKVGELMEVIGDRKIVVRLAK